MTKQSLARLAREKKREISGMALALVLGGTSWATMAHEGHEEVHILPHEVNGLDLTGGTTWFLQGSSGAQNDVVALTYTLDLNIDKDLGERGKVAVAFEAGDGEGVDPDIGTLSAVNYDAFFTELTNTVGGSTNVVALSISQAYYENDFLAGDLVIDVGKLDVHSYFDDNAYANDETDQFLSAIFTRSADTSYKQLDYYYAPGVVAQYQPWDMLAVTAIAANGNSSGFNDIFSNAYFVGQLNFMPNLFGREGNYRIYGLLDSRDSNDTTFTKISSGKTIDNKAWGLSFDQAIAGGIGVFARYSSQDDKIVENLVKSSWSFGALAEGERWKRPHDSAGIAYGSVNINDKPAVLAAAGISDADDERHFEVFYKYGYLHHFTLTADLQLIQNIGGDRHADNVTVYGMRAQLNF